MTLNRHAVFVLAAALAGSALTARLGFWQLERAAQKNALQAQIDGRGRLPPLGIAALATTPQQAAAQHGRLVSVEGHWLARHTVYLDNRQMNARPGFFVVTPLLLADGSAVVVQRGWLARDPQDRRHIALAPAPAGEVRVFGRVAAPPARLFDFGGAASGPIRQNLDLVAYAAETGRRLRPLSIVQEDGPSTAADGLLREWPQPAASSATNDGYAFQWFSFATLIAGLYVWFQLIRPRRR